MKREIKFRAWDGTDYLTQNGQQYLLTQRMLNSSTKVKYQNNKIKPL